MNIIHLVHQGFRTTDPTKSSLEEKTTDENNLSSDKPCSIPKTTRITSPLSSVPGTA